MKKILFLLAFVFSFAFGNLEAKTLSANKKETSFSTCFQHGKKTVSVKSYKRKNGTVVKAHKRSAPRRR